MITQSYFFKKFSYQGYEKDKSHISKEPSNIKQDQKVHRMKIVLVLRNIL